MTASKKIYLDYAATTPVDPAALRAMQPYFSEKFGNAGSLHSFGQEAMAALDRSREVIAAAVGADFREIIFTGSATEANNLVLRGILARARAMRHERTKFRIIISSIEHESILETARDLEQKGVEIVYLPVDRTGTVDLKRLVASLNKNTILVSVMYANNEIGTVQPIKEIAAVIRALPPGDRPWYHTDASQAFQFFDCSVAKLGVDLMTFSSHKIYGPKGAGALYAAARYQPSPILTGGGQEFGLRSGTENVPAIVGFSRAVELLSGSRRRANKRIAKLRDELWRGIKKIYPKTETNGGERKTSLPNILNIYFPGHDAQDILTQFDLYGLAVSSGSACHARASRSSYVVEALGYGKERARSSIRFSLGWPTTRDDISGALKIIKKSLV
jgi:cysteine desulfurase